MRFEYRHFPVIDEHSTRAALASECAGEQDRFWDYHDQLFRRSEGEGGDLFTDAGLKDLALDLGLEASSFDACLSSDRYADRVKQDRRVGLDWGISATPSFVINGRVVRGLQDYQFYRRIIEEEIAKAP